MRRIALGVCLVLAAPACAPKQKVTLGCVPEAVTVYVDGEALEEVPETLKLRRDRHHTLYLKGPGYRPEFVLLRSEGEEGDLWLSPSEVCVRPVLVDVERRLELEIEEEEPAGGAEPDPVPAGSGP